MTPMDRDEMSEDIHLVMTETVEGFNKTIMDSGEHLGAGEFTEFNDEMFTEAIDAQQEKYKTVLSVQLFLSDVKDAIRVIDTVLGPATEIYSGHLKRVMDARNTVLVALKAKIKLNDSNLKVGDNARIKSLRKNRFSNKTLKIIHRFSKAISTKRWNRWPRRQTKPTSDSRNKNIMIH